MRFSPYIKKVKRKRKTKCSKILGLNPKWEHYKRKHLHFLELIVTGVAVIHGHTACVSVEFQDHKPGTKRDKVFRYGKIFNQYLSSLNYLHPVHIRLSIVMNQTGHSRKKTETQRMRWQFQLRGRAPVILFRFVGLHHNTIRGAAGGCVLTAELLKAKVFVRLEISD